MKKIILFILSALLAFPVVAQSYHPNWQAMASPTEFHVDFLKTRLHSKDLQTVTDACIIGAEVGFQDKNGPLSSGNLCYPHEAGKKKCLITER